MPPTSAITLPGFKDIISIPRGDPPTKDQLQEYYAARRAGRPPNLTPDQITNIERRRSIREKIQSSPQPETARNWAKVLTWLDDAQDLFALVAFGGRLAATLGGLKFGGTLGGKLVGLQVAGRIAPRILGRMIPGLGWVLLAGDILKLLTLISSLIAPFFVAACHGLSTGALGAMPSLMMGNALKLAGHGITSLNPFSRVARLRRVARFGGRLFRFGEMIEIAQAMKTLTGYGLTLGGLVGMFQEIYYGAALQLRGERVDIRLPGGQQIQISPDAQRLIRREPWPTELR